MGVDLSPSTAAGASTCIDRARRSTRRGDATSTSSPSSSATTTTTKVLRQAYPTPTVPPSRTPTTSARPDLREQRRPHRTQPRDRQRSPARRALGATAGTIEIIDGVHGHTTSTANVEVSIRSEGAIFLHQSRDLKAAKIGKSACWRGSATPMAAPPRDQAGRARTKGRASRRPSSNTR